MMRGWIVRLQGNRFQVVLFRSRPVPGKATINKAKRRVSFGHRRINFERAQCSRPSSWKRFTRRNDAVLGAEQAERISQTHVCRRVGWFDVNSLLRVLKSFAQTFDRTLIPEIAALEVNLKGFRAVGVTLLDLSSFFAAELQLERMDYLFGNGILNGEDISELLVKLFCPQRDSVFHTDQLHRDANVLTFSLNDSRQKRIDVKFSSH